MENIELVKLLLIRCSEVNLTPMLWGKHGIGKSAIIKQIFTVLGYDVIDLRLGQLEVGDLIGMPDKQFYCPECGFKYGTVVTQPYCIRNGCVDKKLPLVGETIWHPPSWFPKNGEKRCIFFDEFNRGRLDVQQAAFQIVLDRRIHTHKIPDNCMIICACNPPSTDAGTGQEYNVEEIDPALLDRFVNIKFTLTTANWLKWAREVGLLQDAIDFIATENKFLGNEAIDIPVEITPSPRSYEFLSKLLSCNTIPKKYWTDVAETVIGATAAIAFVQSLKSDIEKPIKAIDIFNNFEKIQDKILSQAKAGEGNTKFDLLSITLDEIRHALSDGKGAKYSDKQLKNLGDFFVMLPQDLVFSILKELALNPDINERLLLNRDDLFDILQNARSGAVG